MRLAYVAIASATFSLKSSSSCKHWEWKIRNSWQVSCEKQNTFERWEDALPRLSYREAQLGQQGHDVIVGHDWHVLGVLANPDDRSRGTNQYLQQINQSINQSISQSINQSVSQSVNQSVNQPDRPTNQPTNQAINQQVNQ